MALALKAGDIVVVPTETVYGLASTLQPDALLRIFKAKGRPEYKPLIVGVDGPEMARTITGSWPAGAQTLAETFWPGPLSLVLPKSEKMPYLVTAGGPSVAVRAPAHGIAFSLIRLVGAPLVLTSANLSGGASPKTAAEVVGQLGCSPAYVFDDGPSIIGVESTVYDIAQRKVLREGSISSREIELALRD
ncbi:MAG: L-threonylcarbamoyladenylate synthase [Armatimonadota bacterium]|nr:L-threonylcarbamoyladenylate synthase [Armatimonadota bacterium]